MKTQVQIPRMTIKTEWCGVSGIPLLPCQDGRRRQETPQELKSQLALSLWGNKEQWSCIKVESEEWHWSFPPSYTHMYPPHIYKHTNMSYTQMHPTYISHASYTHTHIQHTYMQPYPPLTMHIHHSHHVLHKHTYTLYIPQTHTHMSYIIHHTHIHRNISHEYTPYSHTLHTPQT